MRVILVLSLSFNSIFSFTPKNKLSNYAQVRKLVRVTSKAIILYKKIYKNRQTKYRKELYIKKKDIQKYLSLFYTYAGNELEEKVKYYFSYKNKSRSKKDIKIIKNPTYRLQKILIKNKKIRKKQTKNLKKPLPLQGVRIAIDPGHTAGNINEAIFESRFVILRDGKKQLKFFEADLSYKLALLLKSYYEKKGAKVYLSHKYGVPAIGMKMQTFYNNKKLLTKFLQREFAANRISKKEFSQLQDPINFFQRKKFFFREVDLRTRAENINKFKPHLSLLLHFNGDGSTQGDYRNKLLRIERIVNNYRLNEKNKVQRITQVVKEKRGHYKQYGIYFIPGGFYKDEMKHFRSRIEFLRLYLSKNWKNSLNLASSLATNITHGLNVPIWKKKRSSGYRIYTGKKGVFSRNVKMTRLLHSPVVLLEPFLQENLTIARALSKKGKQFGKLNIPPIIVKLSKLITKSVDEYLRDIIKQ